MTLGIVGLTPYGAVAASDSKRGIQSLDLWSTLPVEGFTYTKKLFTLGEDKVMLHAGSINYQVRVAMEIELGEDPLLAAIKDFELRKDESPSELAKRLAEYLNVRLKDNLIPPSLDIVEQMKETLRASIPEEYRDSSNTTYSQDFNGLVQRAHVKNRNTITVAYRSLESLICGFNGKAFEVYKINTPSIQAPEKLLIDRFGFFCIGESEAASSHLRQCDWRRMSLEEATQAVADTIIKVSEQCPSVGGPIDCASLEHGKPIGQRVIVPKPATKNIDDFFSTLS